MKSSTDWVSCPECNGTGEQEYEQNVPMGYDNPYGYVDTYMDGTQGPIAHCLR